MNNSTETSSDMNHHETPDLTRLPEFVRGHRLAELGKAHDDPDYDVDPELVDLLEDAEVVTSWTGRRDDVMTGWDGTRPLEDLLIMPETYHRPILDIDFPVAVLDSSTPGHHHLYLDKVMTWTQYAKLLDVLAEVGIIEPGYRDASIARAFTSIRLPWVKKPAPDGELVHLVEDEGRAYCGSMADPVAMNPALVTCPQCAAAIATELVRP